MQLLMTSHKTNRSNQQLVVDASYYNVAIINYPDEKNSYDSMTKCSLSRSYQLQNV